MRELIRGSQKSGKSRAAESRANRRIATGGEAVLLAAVAGAHRFSNGQPGNIGSAYHFCRRIIVDRTHRAIAR